MSSMVVRTLVALVVAGGATVASLLAVVWMSSDAPAARSDARPTMMAFEIAPTPAEEPLPAPVQEEVAPALAAATPDPSTARDAAPPPRSALSPGLLGAPAPSGIGGLPMLGSGLSAGALPLPAAESTDAGAVDAPARPLSRPAPRYPRQAHKSGTEGFVIVRLRVDERGRVTDAVVVEGTPPGVFDDVAVQTAKTYRFSPAQRGGKAVATTVQQRIVFRLGR